jgi:hypothetical protein
VAGAEVDHVRRRGVDRRGELEVRPRELDGAAAQRGAAGVDRHEQPVFGRQVRQRGVGDLSQALPGAALAMDRRQERERRDHRARRPRAIGRGRGERQLGEARRAIAILEPLQPHQREATVAISALAGGARRLGPRPVQGVDVIPALGAGQDRLEHDVGRRLVEVLGQDRAQGRLERRIVGGLEPEDAGRAQEHAGRGGVVELGRLRGQALDLVEPELRIVLQRGQGVLDPGCLGGALDGALEDGRGLVALAAVEERLTDDAGQLRRGGGALQLHLAELGDHLVAPKLRVDLAGARQRLQVVRMELPGSLVQTERAFPLRDHVLGQASELEQALGLLRLRPGGLQLLLQLIDSRGPIAGPAQALPQQRARVHVRSILAHLQGRCYPWRSRIGHRESTFRARLPPSRAGAIRRAEAGAPRTRPPRGRTRARRPPASPPHRGAPALRADHATVPAPRRRSPDRPSRPFVT